MILLALILLILVLGLVALAFAVAVGAALELAKDLGRERTYDDECFERKADFPRARVR